MVDRSFDFALKIIGTKKQLCNEKKEHVLSKQLLKSVTSVGANFREAVVSQSKKEFITKLNISLKEINETQ